MDYQQPQGQPGSPGYYQGGNLLQRLTPEGLQAFMRMGEMESQDSDLQAQIAQAHELRNAQGPQRYGAVAGGLQGLADILRAYKGKQQEEQLRTERKGLLGNMTKQREIIGRNYMPTQPQPQQGAMPDPSIPELLRRPE